MDGVAVFLINLPRSVERRQAMEARLADLGLPYTLVPGVDGRAEWDRLAPTVDAPAFSRRMGREVLPGDAGCYHAHLKAWGAFLDTEAPVALILEDDVIFHADFLPALDKALHGRSNWDFLQLNCIRAKHPITQARLGEWRLNAYLGPATGMATYLITRELVQRLLPNMLPIRMPIDHELDRIHVHRFRHLGLEPFPSHVDDEGQSTITGAAFEGLRKRVWYRRLPSYWARFGSIFNKAAYLWQTGALWPKVKTG
ncbi:MAG: glycosyltransferase family 25 protein [Tabrizicola sp.]|jgi:glycosyl transferase family 25|nr:glycosyltransferase family 25 protein [Tabrizicola sp.]